MAEEVDANASFVLKAEELPALNYLSKGHPKPISLTWINRGTDQPLRPTTVDMLLRTLFHDSTSPSVSRLHHNSGLRVVFASATERDAFATAFARAHTEMSRKERYQLTAVFDSPQAAESGLREMAEAGISSGSISILWRAGQFIHSKHDEPLGHSRFSVAAVSTGAGLAGALFGMSLLTIPGLGLVAVGGAMAAQAIGTIGAVGGALGASGGGIARMLTDIDVDDRDIPYCIMEITSGKVFISVDPKICGSSIETVHEILSRNGGRIVGQNLDSH